MITNELQPCQFSDTLGLERTRYFQRQLVTPSDLTQDQQYFRDKLRRHNRLLHGWGVVCGAEVRDNSEIDSGDFRVAISPGYILGPYGDEILIDREVVVDLLHEDIDGFAVLPCTEVSNPWCGKVRINRSLGVPYYLAIKYVECQLRPVRVATTTCSCDEADCQYSRIRDSFSVKILSCLPSSYQESRQPPSFSIVHVEKDETVTIKTHNFPRNTVFDLFMHYLGTCGINGYRVATINSGNGGEFESTFAIHPALKCEKRIALRFQSMDSYAYNWFYNVTGGNGGAPLDNPDCDPIMGSQCLTCPSEPWIILADITLKDDGRGIEKIDCFAHRRFVAAFANPPFIGHGEGEHRKTDILNEDVIEDCTATAEGCQEKPEGFITIKRPNGDTAFLAIRCLKIHPGDTVGQLLTREGQRKFLDRITGKSFTLSEIFALAGDDPSRVVKSVADLLGPIQGLHLRIDDLRRTQAEMGKYLDKEGIEFLYSKRFGAPKSMANLPATALRGVSTRSSIGKKVASQRIADIVEKGEDAFVNEIVQGVSRGKPLAAKQAKEIWARAKQVAMLGESWK